MPRVRASASKPRRDGRRRSKRRAQRRSNRRRRSEARSRDRGDGGRRCWTGGCRQRGGSPEVKLRLDSVLVNALVARLQEEALHSAEVSDDAVRAYYEQNHDRYAAEERIKIWQIVLASRADADAVLKAIHDDKDWDKDPVG